MDALSLTAVADEQLAAARTAGSGRSAHTVHGGREHRLRQTVLALAAGRSLGEHDSPGEATLYILRGRVRVTGTTGSWEAAAGDYLPIPPERHDLLAIDDSAVLLTVAAS